MPDGEAFYQAQIEKHTTLTLTPQQIHDIGLKEVARLEAEMRATKDKAKFKGTMAEFFTFMRTDPQFYAKTPRELLSYSAYVAKKADDKLAETIGFLPRRRHGIRPVPDALAPIYTGGRGGLEACLMNTYNLPARPLYTLAPLTLHECTPGHSFQAALALEGPERPAFRRGTSFSGYGEGWGLYTEWLGTVMGIYETPYEDMGRLTYEMWRACRLVIDTGIHQFGWTREQAMSYLRDRAPLAEHEITTEIDRYIAWPGQALAYKLGELQIRRHRREAEEKLGAQIRSAALSRCHPGDRLGAAAGAGAAHGTVHRRRERCEAIAPSNAYHITLLRDRRVLVVRGDGQPGAHRCAARGAAGPSEERAVGYGDVRQRTAARRPQRAADVVRQRHTRHRRPRSGVSSGPRYRRPGCRSAGWPRRDARSITASSITSAAAARIPGWSRCFTGPPRRLASNGARPPRAASRQSTTCGRPSSPEP